MGARPESVLLKSILGSQIERRHHPCARWCRCEPPPFDLTIPSSIQKYELPAIDHSIPAISGAVAALEKLRRCTLVAPTRSISSFGFEDF